MSANITSSNRQTATPPNHQTTPSPNAGHAFWKGLDELEDSSEFRQWMHEEFPGGMASLDDLDGPSRRTFLKMAAASFALASLPACSDEPHEKIVPYVHEPDDVVPGEPQKYATTLTRGGFALGVLAESHMGRPTKIEGNPDHPSSLGATDLFAQAEVMRLCDPQRSQSVKRHDGQIDTWDAFARMIRDRLSQSDDGTGLALLTGRITSPTLLDQISQLHKRYPGMRWYVHEPIDEQTIRDGTSQALGQPRLPDYHFDQAKAILSLDSDFLFALPDSVRYAREFADQRRVNVKDGEDAKSAAMNRLYVVEPSPSITGAKADHRLALRPTRIETLGPVLLALIRQAQGQSSQAEDAGADDLDSHTRHWLEVAAKDLVEKGRHGLVLAGRSQPAEVHTLVHQINTEIGSVGTCVTYHPPVDRPAEGELTPGTLADLTRPMHAGEVSTLFMLDSDPIYNAPADLAFARALKQVDLTVHHGLYRDETGKMCDWHLPMNHELESWSDARSPDGTPSIVQPLIRPLYAGKTPAEVLAIMLQPVASTDHQLVRAYWQKHAADQGQAISASSFETWWRRVLRDGVIPESPKSKVQSPKPPTTKSSHRQTTKPPNRQTTKPPNDSPAPSLDDSLETDVGSGGDGGEGGMELALLPSSTLWDGRYANNGWLQEIPDPLSKIVWDNAALFSPAEGMRLGLHNNDVVRIAVDDHQIEAPVWLMPGHAEGCISIALGYGRRDLGHVGNDVGVNAYPLRTTNQPWTRTQVSMTKTAKRHPLISTQQHQDMADRHVYRQGTLEQFHTHPEKIKKTPGEDLHLSMYDSHEYQSPQQWGMSIDLTTCIGCNACTVACNSENNIPVVGKGQVEAGREMHWIRIDRYFEGSPDNPAFNHQPVPCMQCEDAPCELVCPTGATQHSEDGLNDMVYNRCIGTRYCSNNCPYKVRRFNFFDYVQDYVETEQLMRNPDVTVRGRGVMEKCTYCVQRIRRAEIDAKTDDDTQPWIPDDDLQTACQQVCPTQAITFGDINDPNSAVTQAKAQPHDYAMLEHLNTHPRTTYLAEVRNPHPELG